MNNITPSFVILLLFLCVVLLAVRKENIIVPLSIAMCFLPADISMNLGVLNFSAIRVLALVGLVKIIFGDDQTRIRFNTIDKHFFLYNMLGAIVYWIASENKFSVFLYKSGYLIDSVVLYVVLRNAIQTKESLRLIIKTFSYCIVILLPFTIFEFFSASNLFSILGRSAISLRGDEIRAAATFSHAILFGSFAVALVPILWAEHKIQPSKLNWLAILSCVFFIYASSSSGPIVVFIVVVLLLLFFRWKQYSSYLSWFIFISAIVIHFVRNNPLWYFIYVGITVKSNSAGWHRVLLMDAAVKEFWDWWLFGYGDLGPQWHTKYWSYTYATFTDVTNQYILEGVRGGFFTMLLFVWLCFKVIKVLGAFSISRTRLAEQWLWWGFTVMMIAHCVTFLSVTYFGQITMLFYLTIAVAAFTYDEMLK